MDWDTARVDEHKILQKVTSEELEEIFHKPVCFPAFLCHSQSVECSVKLVSTLFLEGLRSRVQALFYLRCL